MRVTLLLLLAFCACSLGYVLVIPYFGKAKLLTSFLPQDVRAAAAGHPDPSPARLAIGYALTALMAAAFAGVMALLVVDGVRRGYDFWHFFGRFLIFMYGYKLFDILVQDQLIVITLGYFIKFYPETRDCPGWRDRRFNEKAQRARLIMFPFLCALTAWICTLF